MYSILFTMYKPCASFSARRSFSEGGAHLAFSYAIDLTASRDMQFLISVANFFMFPDATIQSLEAGECSCSVYPQVLQDGRLGIDADVKGTIGANRCNIDGHLPAVHIP
jgi:hypothetical protein